MGRRKVSNEKTHAVRAQVKFELLVDVELDIDLDDSINEIQMESLFLAKGLATGVLKDMKLESIADERKRKLTKFEIQGGDIMDLDLRIP